ncbi:hypothetical protein KY285_014217 [Solanum tuberosum]|nr:hypothetical protein KY285_014217 [Solanum tuberosum]
MSTTGDDWAGNCVLMIVGLYAIDRGLPAIDSYRKYRKEKEQNVKKEQKRGRERRLVLEREEKRKRKALSPGTGREEEGNN